MRIQGLQKLTLLDYPQHIACTIFAQGCNLACPFCHNTEIIKGNGNLIGEPELTEFLNSRKGILEGVCISGGEPLMQNNALDFLEYIKNLGFKVKLDTNGCFPERLNEALNRNLIDYIAMDIKSSKTNYSLASGGDVDLNAICKSVKIIMDSKVDYEFRTTAVKGIHLYSDFEEIASWLEGAKSYYLQQFVDSDWVLSKSCSAFSFTEMEEILNILKPKIPSAEIRGL